MMEEMKDVKSKLLTLSSFTVDTLNTPVNKIPQ